jgi:hypothetical protein
MQTEIKRRSSLTDSVLDLMRAQKNQWVGVHELAKVGGYCAWRTRVSDARKLAELDGETIQWNGQVRESAYRLIDQPLGREAGEPMTQAGLF